MKSVVTFGTIPPPGVDPEAAKWVDIDDLKVGVGLAEWPQETLTPFPVDAAFRVTVAVRAFSCNYRDLALIRSSAKTNSAHIPGSDFVGEVVEVGSAVTRVKVGDRVMPDCSYPDSGSQHVLPGVPTNHASASRVELHETKVIPAPAAMSDAEAAAFSVCSQTAFSIVRRLAVKPGERVLVTGARSNTALCVIRLLVARGARVYALTTTPGAARRVEALGVEAVFTCRRGEPARDERQVLEAAHAMGGFDFVIDPFADCYLEDSVVLLAMGGRYVTCGVAHQSVDGEEPPVPAGNFRDVLGFAMFKNLAIMGNCLGTRSDLEEAFAAFRRGEYGVRVDSVHGVGSEAAFLRRTYADPDRFGKVVYHLEH